MAIKVASFPQCFVCGSENPSGLQLDFAVAPEGTASTQWTAAPSFQGYPGVVHGGILTTVLDETMAKAVQGLGVMGVTAKLEVTFRKPVPVDSTIAISAKVESKQGKRVRIHGEIRDVTGVLLVEGTGLFFLTSNAENH